MLDNARTPTHAILSGLRLLVIENDNDNLEMFEHFFRRCGAHVGTAQTALEARTYLSGQRISAIITGVSVLKESGAEFLRQVRERPQYKDTPVIAVTGWSPKDAARIAGADFTAFILKPVDLDELAATIVRLVPANAA